MAINNGRYVVTGGYMTPAGEIVEEVQYVPNKNNTAIETLLNTSTQSTPAFSNEDVYRLQSTGYANMGDNAMASAYGSLADNLGAYSKFANNSLQGYDALLNYVKGNEQQLQSAAGNLYNQLTSDLQQSRDYVNQMFGPNGELTQEVNKYYDDLGNYLSTEAGRQAATIAAQGIHSGASLGAIRAQQNQAYNEAFGRYVQAKEQQINAKTQLASNLINYMSTLRQEYGNTTNQYVIDLYRRANDMYNNIAQSAMEDLNQYNKLRLQASGGSNSTTNPYSGWFTYDSDGNMVDATGTIIKDKNGNPVSKNGNTLITETNQGGQQQAPVERVDSTKRDTTRFERNRPAILMSNPATGIPTSLYLGYNALTS